MLPDAPSANTPFDINDDFYFQIHAHPDGELTGKHFIGLSCLAGAPKRVKNIFMAASFLA
jgi:hypothetical protein